MRHEGSGAGVLGEVGRGKDCGGVVALLTHILVPRKRSE